jgi:hypothetical protein
MTPKEFSNRTLDDKVKTLYEEGTFIVAIRYYGYKINLYLLHNFYVEVFYNHKHDRIDKIDLMERNASREKFYADQIRLPLELFQ